MRAAYKVTSLPILTLAVGETTGLDANTLLVSIARSKGRNTPLQVVFLGADVRSSPLDFLDSMESGHILWEKSDYDDGSVAAVVSDEASGSTIVLIVAESPSVVNDVVQLLPRLLISDARYVVACRPYLAPVMIGVASRLAFLHLPFINDQAVASSTSFALSRIQFEEDSPRLKGRGVESRAVRDSMTVTLAEPSKKQSEVEKALAEELLKSASRLVKLRFLPPFAARGFNHNTDGAMQRSNCLVLLPKPGHALWGPYMKLPQGDYRAGWLLSTENGDAKSSVSVDVAIDLIQVVERTVLIETNEPEWVWVDFAIDEENQDSPVEFRLAEIEGDACTLHEIVVRSQFE